MLLCGQAVLYAARLVRCSLTDNKPGVFVFHNIDFLVTSPFCSSQSYPYSVHIEARKTGWQPDLRTAMWLLLEEDQGVSPLPWA